MCFFPLNPQNGKYGVCAPAYPPDIRIKEALTAFEALLFLARERHKVKRILPNLKICNSLKFGGVFLIEFNRRVCYNGCVLKRGINRRPSAQKFTAAWLLHKLTA